MATSEDRAETSRALTPGNGKASVFDPQVLRASNHVHDAVFSAIRTSTQFKWRDSQQIGRTALDTMLKHAAVAGPYRSLIEFCKAYQPHFKPSGQDPTPLQRQLADFANEQIRRLGSSGDGRQGWEKFIDGPIAQAFLYGFSLAEMETVRAPWGGQSRIQINRIIPLPQASLDSGFVPMEEFGQGISSFTDPRYACFEMDSAGRITAIHQFLHNGSHGKISWVGGEMRRILHFVHAGGEGNPYGQSILYTAYYHWSNLYVAESIERVFMDTALPYLWASYKTQDGRPSPEAHADLLKILTEQDPALRFLIGPDMTFGSVAPSNPAATEHFRIVKDEERRYIANCIFGVPVMSGSASNELDARNVIQVFFKYFMRALQREVETFITWQFAKPLIDANWSGLNESDYPQLVFQNTLDNDLRTSMPLLQQLLPMLDSNRLGEFAQAMIPGFDSNWVAAEQVQTVSAFYGLSADPSAGNTSNGTPPTKQPGTTEQPQTGTKTGLSGRVDTAV